MKYLELKVDQNKKELSKLELPTSGTKTEPRKRLMEEFQHRGLDVKTYDFEYKDQVEVCTSVAPGNMDFSAMFATLIEKLEENSKIMKMKLEENSQQTSESFRN